MSLRFSTFFLVSAHAKKPAQKRWRNDKDGGKTARPISAAAERSARLLYSRIRGVFKDAAEKLVEAQGDSLHAHTLIPNP